MSNTYIMRFSGFWHLPIYKRHEIIKKATPLDEEDVDTLKDGGLSVESADNLVENVIGTFAMPLGIATNFRINDADIPAVPMVTEEPSVIAAASAGAKAASHMKAYADMPRVRGQIQVMNPQTLKNLESVVSRKKIAEKIRTHLSSHMDIRDEDITYAVLAEDMLKVEFVVNTGNAMGANAVNTACEGVAPLIEEMTGGTVLLRILSNHMQRMGSAESYFDVAPDVAKKIVSAYRFAQLDKFRSVTHNKGIMNGVSAVGVATGQDTRALEAGAHAYASEYGPLSKWDIKDGRLYGSLSMPIAVGTVGGLTKHHPVAAACLKMLGEPTAQELAGIMMAVGLCQNFSALRALTTVGIQKGHMKLHGKRLS